MRPLFELLPKLIPMECMQVPLIQQAFIGLILLAPMAAAMGVQVVNFRMAFFTDAISHSAFTGIALGLILSASPYGPQVSMPLFAVVLGVAIVALQKNSRLSTDTVIGVMFSVVVSFGIAIVSRNRNMARQVQQFLYGDILTISETEIWLLLGLFVLIMLFQFWGYNQMLYIGLNPVLAGVHRVKVSFFQYSFAVLLSLVVIFSVWAVGVILVTALLIVPAAAARNFAKSAGAMFWWALLISITSAIVGFLVSVQEWAQTATGATVILCSCCWFGVSVLVAMLRKNGKN